MRYPLILLGGFILAATMARVIIPRILIISLRKRLFDVPDLRKVHQRPISRLGGVSFFPAILFTIAFLIGTCSITHWTSVETITKNWTQMLLMCAGLTLLFTIGIADDLIGVRYRQKLLVQVISAAMFPLAGLYINDFYGLFGIHTLTSFVGIPFTIILVVFITNAINLIDGIDGLASGLSMVALSMFGILAIIDEKWLSALLAFTTIGVLLPFFYYNVFGNADRGRKIFMGDTGSLTLGFILSFLTIQYTMNTYETGISYEGAILIAFSVLLVPCLDVIRVVIGRVRRGRNPFMPDKTHIHHKFLAMGFTPRKAMIFILCISFLFCVSNIILVSYMDNTILFICDVVIWIAMNLYIDKVISRHQILEN
ncbi:MraY family glycosyltransferase [Phocaeicola sp.]